MRSAGQHQCEHVIAQVANVLTLESEILGLEPGSESGDAIGLGRVAAALDASGHGAGEAVAGGAADQVGAEGANGEERGGHGLRWVVGAPPPPMHIM